MKLLATVYASFLAALQLAQSRETTSDGFLLVKLLLFVCSIAAIDLVLPSAAWCLVHAYFLPVYVQHILQRCM